ncbi:MAG TPA: hypothetical protein VGF24_07970 [Vicinamibacterales bacterium]
MRIACAAAVFLFTALYRFNTLGGTFGGFDNDHFVPFAAAKQVEAGEQPLRDFSGLGLQGVWPSLTYEVSAWAQRRLGDNLRSEALVTIGGVAAGAAMTFLLAGWLSNTFWAIVATPISVFVAPTLYNYPKVLLISAAGLVIAAYARRATLTMVCVGAVLTAIAFLFRHDYAVYAAVGILLGYLASGQWRRAIRHGVVYAALTTLLLTPSLVYVIRYAGLVQYVRDSVEVSRREGERVPLLTWPSFTLTTESGGRVSAATFFDVEQNGVTWLYDVMRVLPFVAAFAAWKARHEDGRQDIATAGLAIAGMAAFAIPFLIRGNIAVRLGDVGPLFAVLFALSCNEATRARPADRARSRRRRVALVVVLLVGTALSARTVGYVGGQLRVAGMFEGWGETRYRTQLLWAALADLPQAALQDDRPDNPLKVSRYINRCTLPSDRIVVMAYEPQTLPYAGRLFGAGRVSVIPKYILGPQNEAELVGFWRHQSVPLVLVEYEEFLTTTGGFPLVAGYLHEHYREAGRVAVSDSKTLRVFARTDRTAVSTFGPEQLPCFR